jgi:hypothetical protein
MTFEDDIRKLLGRPGALKLLAEPEAEMAVLRQVEADMAARRLAIARIEAEVVVKATGAAIGKVVGEMAAQMAAQLRFVSQTIKEIRQADASRKLLEALNYAAHRNGSLTFDREKLREALR